MSDSDLYSILGVSRNSTPNEIKAAYRKQALRYHPDRNPGDAVAEKKFKEINNAYSILSDSNKRAAYDHSGSSDFAENSGSYKSHGFSEDAFSDMFGQFFGSAFGFNPFDKQNSNRANTSIRGEDIQQSVSISLEEAYTGVSCDVFCNIKEYCSLCDGYGSSSKKTTVCSLCNGKGSIISNQGFISIEKTCYKCSGRGVSVANPCRRCRGEGIVLERKTFAIKIPQGIRDQHRIRLSGKGNCGPFRGPRGDLYVLVDVRKHHKFKREGDDLFCTQYVPFTLGILGGKTSISFMDHKELIVDIPAETQNNTRIVIRKYGMPRLQASGFGNLYIDIILEVPRKISTKARRLLKDLEREIELDNYVKAKICKK